MTKPLKVLAFSREAGGAAAIAPICKMLKNNNDELLLLAKEQALSLFKDRQLNATEFAYDETLLNKLCQDRFGNLPERLLTSAASLPHLDMTERLLWRWAQKNNVPSIAILDQWQNYALRFSGPTPDEKLVYFPDKICVMDELAKREMIEDGIPTERIFITGQPAFDWLRRSQRNIELTTISLREKLNIPANRKVVTFVAESLKRDFRDTLGYDEQITLQAVGTILTDLNLANLTLIIKLHPQNQLAEFETYIQQWPELDARLIGREYSPPEVLSISDLVIGMSSVMLIEAAVIGKPVISLELGALKEPQLALTRCGILPFIIEQIQAHDILHAMLTDTAALSAHLAKQASWSAQTDATKKCLSVLLH